jgi:phosphatidylglycerol lysyltransferase
MSTQGVAVAADPERRRITVPILALVTLGSGIANLLSLLDRAWPRRTTGLIELFPMEFLHISRFITLVIGFALIVSSLNIYRRKERAFHTVLILSCASVVFHLTRGLNYEDAIVSLALVGLLLATRDQFRVRSAIPNIGSALLVLAVATVVVLGYGIAGFWYMDRRDFGIDFTLPDSFRQTLEFLTLQSDPAIVAHTGHARWFLTSLNVIATVAAGYSLVQLYRPVAYRFSIGPRDHAAATEIVASYGRSALDYFKTWPDKTLFFSPSRRAFLAYRVAGSHAVVLGDPVGPEEEIKNTIQSFMVLCEESDWRLGFHQTLPDFLPIYRSLGFKKLKIGDDAIVDLTRFSLDGRKMREFRNALARLGKAGVQFRRYDPPIPREIIHEMRDVSNEGLRFSGRRERQFSLGTFQQDYVGSTSIAAATDAGGRILAFVNIIPSYHQGETTIDLMRRRTEAPNGIMDFLFVNLFLESRRKGFTRFNFGLAPMSGFAEQDESSREERAIHAFFQRLNFLFSYRGLRSYKAKFGSSWEPRYLVYRNALDLPRMAIALGRISERKD